jgi:hypothetical protein
MQEAKSIPIAAINLVDESFDIKKANSYHLSILASHAPNSKGRNQSVGFEQFTFSVLDTKTNKYLVLKKGNNLSDFFPLEKEGNWASVTCAVAHNKVTLVPSAIFDDANKESFLGFNHPIENGEKIHSDTLKNMDARNVFTIATDFEALFRKHFINIYFIHDSTSFIQGLLIQNKNPNPLNAGVKREKVFANFHSSYFDIVILLGHELIFSNAFNYKAPEDIAYYILFVYEQLRLNPEEIELVLSGEIDKTAEGHALLYNYIRHVKFASLPDLFKYSYKFDEIQSHRFVSLFNQYVCA